MSEQSEVIAFLADPASYRNYPAEVECIETHGALVFLAGSEVYKIKRAVKYPYMDFSTFEKRQRAVEREIEVNSDHAPQIYRGVVPIVRSLEGAFHFGADGEGEIVEWAVHMNRFPQAALLSAFASRGELNTELAKKIAAMIVNFHKALKSINNVDAQTTVELILRGLSKSLKADSRVFNSSDVAQFEQFTSAFVKRLSPDFLRRSQGGFIRRCHGDLHLNNIVMIDGNPVVFDAIEFDERLAEIDIFYDLAFLLMDLDYRGLRGVANLILSRYLLAQDQDASYEGLKLLPLFLSLRAAVRAMVTAQRAQNVDEDEAGGDIKTARTYFHQALSYLAPTKPRLVAVGGLSGTGKSTLAALLAPDIGAVPGALHLRSDLERKKLFGVSETVRLSSKSYTQESTEQVFSNLNHKAALSLKAGHSVIVDAVFAKSCEREAIEKVARDLGVPFEGLWLEAKKQTLIERVAARKGDASDATPAIVEMQVQYDVGNPTWSSIDANGPIIEMQQQARKVLGL